MAKFPQTEAFILAGGQSSRMGRDKALLEIGGKTLIERAAALCEPLVANVTLMGRPERYKEVRFPALADQWHAAGPLGAIATALGAARQPWCLVLACDMPNVTTDFLEWLLHRTAKTSADAIIPETTRGVEPLCAVYRPSCAPPLSAGLDSGVRKVTDGLERLKIERVTENDWRKFSPGGDLFQNLNTWEEYRSAKERIESQS
ncbi:MAG TPA: molybdenum cofactor guanylyltransferase [Candidatus Acidoferrales bacterium]|jgi:molybdopterin-guanine dinucleotide biosynthesis protein A|nr:molybdenum cofactor guanylyltransferase [Candidatus Acidoferrales bacterium]